MKKLTLFSFAAICMNATAMDKAVKTVDETDPVIAQVQMLKALKSKEAPYHEKNSFLDAYMNPSSFTKISGTHVSFTHHKYPGIFYDLLWDTVLTHLAEATQESNKFMATLNDKNEQAQLLENISKDPLGKLTERQKYLIQIMCFAAFINNEDVDKKSVPMVDLGNIILNRANYKCAFYTKNPKKITECSMTELRAKRFENLTERIKGMRFMTIMKPMAQGAMMMGVLGGVLGARPANSDCIIS